MQTYNSSLFIGQVSLAMMDLYFFLIFQQLYKTFKMPVGITNKIIDWESKGLSNEKIKPPITANYSLPLKLIWMNNSKIRVEFKGSCLEQDKVTFTPRNVVNLFTAYQLDMVTRLKHWFYS